MRVAFPTNNQKTIAQHIGLAKGFLIVDTQNGEKFYIENPVLKRVQEEHIKLNGDCGEHGLGTGRVVPPLLKEAGVSLFVGREFGEGMLGNLEYEGIKTFVTDEKEIDAVLSQLKDSLMNSREMTTETFQRGLGFGRGGRMAQRNLNGRGLGRGLNRRNQRSGGGRGQGFGRRAGLGRGAGFGFGFGFRGGWDG
jgi:predicted Fe-Mo cluster-binding NifX family protein